MRNNTIWNILQKEIFYWIDKLFLATITIAFLSFLLWLEMKYEMTKMLWSFIFSVD